MRESSSFTVVLPNTLSTITLKKSPSRKDTKTDSDGDTLPDSKEIKWDLIKEEGDILILPTLFEYAGYHPLVFARLSKKKKEYLHSLLILPIYSNPASKDSDHDGYDDNKDKRPLVKSVKKYSLKRKDYIPIQISKDMFSYGSSQMWFETKDKLSSDYILYNDGCGTIALADLFIYWAGQNAAYNTVWTTNCMKEQPFKKEFYMQYIRFLNTFIETPRWGLLGNQIADLGASYAKTYKIPYKVNWESNLSDEKMEKIIVEMLSNDLPVIFSVGPNTPDMWGNKSIDLFKLLKEGDEGFIHGKNALYQYGRDQGTYGHYMTITEIIYDENTVNEDEAIMLHVATWGRELYIKYGEYRDYVKNIGGKWTSSLVHIRKK